VTYLKKLGKIHIISKKGNLLVKVTKQYRMNTEIVNQQLKKLGKIVDIIGPTKNPYLVISTREAEAEATIGETVYLLDSPAKKKVNPKKNTVKSRNKK